jgi:hypothetical protein
MVRSRKEVDSPDRVPEMLGAGGICDRQLTVQRQEKGQRLNTENTEAGARRSQRKKLTQFTGEREDKDLTPVRARRRMRHKKKKGETAVQPQIHPRAIIQKLNRFASPNFS